MPDQKHHVIANNALALDAAVRKTVAKRVDYKIAGVKGLRLVAHPTGTRTWVARYQIGAGREDRRERSVVLGPFKGSKAAKENDGLKLAEACDRVAEIRRGAKQGIDPLARRQELREADTFQSLAEHWLAFKAREGRAKSYLANSKSRLCRLPEWFRLKKAREIRRVDIVACLEGVAERGGAETNQTQAFISTVLGLGVGEGLLETNTTLGVKRRFKENTRDRVLSAAEFKSLWEGIDGLGATQGTKLALKVCMATGQRPKEICELKQSRLALDAPMPTVTIEKTSAKNRTEHVVPLPKIAVELLRQAVNEAQSCEFVFPAKSGVAPLNSHVLSTALYRARTKDGKLFGHADMELYDCKSTIATFLGNAGYPDQIVGLLFNHKTAKSGSVTGKHYNHSSYLTQKHAMIEQWARHLEEVIGMRTPIQNVVAFSR